MAAPSTAYSQSYLGTGQLNTATPPVLESNMLALLPKCLSTYGSTANTKLLFYLDYVGQMKDAAGNDVFIAAVKTSGPNFEMHKMDTGAGSRQGKGRLLIGGQVHVILNDGGLNTFTNIDFYGVAPGVDAVVYKNYFRTNIRFSSAFYATTSARSVLLEQLVDNVVTRTFEFPFGAMVEKEIAVNPIFCTDSYGLTAVGNISFRITATATNEEGIKYWSGFTFLASQKLSAHSDAEFYGTQQLPTTNPTGVKPIYIKEVDYNKLGNLSTTSNPDSTAAAYKEDLCSSSADPGWYNILYPSPTGYIRLFYISLGVATHYYDKVIQTLYLRFVAQGVESSTNFFSITPKIENLVGSTGDRIVRITGIACYSNNGGTMQSLGTASFVDPFDINADSTRHQTEFILLPSATSHIKYVTSTATALPEQFPISAVIRLNVGP